MIGHPYPGQQDQEMLHGCQTLHRSGSGEWVHARRRLCEPIYVCMARGTGVKMNLQWTHGHAGHETHMHWDNTHIEYKFKTGRRALWVMWCIWYNEMINDILQPKFCLQGEWRKGIQQNDNTMQMMWCGRGSCCGVNWIGTLLSNHIARSKLEWDV